MSEHKERRSLNRIDCFNRTILNDSIEHGLVVDINNEGAGLLLPKDQSLFRNDGTVENSGIAGNVRLTIIHPDMPVQNGISFDAEIVWVDKEYSDDRNKIGVKFIDTIESQTDPLAEWLSRDENYYFHCELEKR